ncbi:Aspartate/alanine antiporter [Phycisphaerae bacterium RAS1]|nr:Aspartate/alanine antiporter [Phycisphaerae bacterium RAS1]
MLALFAITALGLAVGMLRLGGVALGSAGVFFVALGFGHFGVALPREITELGLVLFVYSVGLEAGSRFFSLLHGRGLALLAVGTGATAAGALGAALIALALGLSAPMAAGVFCGATTCTPALASALDAIRSAAPDVAYLASVAYGATYPFSVASVVLTAQLLPRWLRTTPDAAADEYHLEEAARTPPLEQCVFRVENPNCVGRTIEDLVSLDMFRAVLCRVKRGSRVEPARPGLILELGDAVLAVGPPQELAKLEALIGGVVVEVMHDANGRVTSDEVVVSRGSAIGRTLGELCLWERFSVVVSRARRDGIEISPDGHFRLEPGDLLRLVGPPDAVASVTTLLGREEARLNETSLLPFAAGIALGAALGAIAIPLPGGLRMQLGPAGGALLVGLLLGRFGALGPLRLHVPVAVKHFGRELGLVIFLAGAGSAAGEQFLTIIAQTGVRLFLAGALVTAATTATAILVACRVLRWNALVGDGAVCACLTNPAALSAARRLADSEAAAVGFASVYPVALLSKILLAPALYLLLARLT